MVASWQVSVSHYLGGRRLIGGLGIPNSSVGWLPLAQPQRKPRRQGLGFLPARSGMTVQSEEPGHLRPHQE